MSTLSLQCRSDLSRAWWVLSPRNHFYLEPMAPSRLNQSIIRTHVFRDAGLGPSLAAIGHSLLLRSHPCLGTWAPPSFNTAKEYGSHAKYIPLWFPLIPAPWPAGRNLHYLRAH